MKIAVLSFLYTSMLAYAYPACTGIICNGQGVTANGVTVCCLIGSYGNINNMDVSCNQDQGNCGVSTTNTKQCSDYLGCSLETGITTVSCPSNTFEYAAMTVTGTFSDHECCCRQCTIVAGKGTFDICTCGRSGYTKLDLTCGGDPCWRCEVVPEPSVPESFSSVVPIGTMAKSNSVLTKTVSVTGAGKCLSFGYRSGDVWGLSMTKTGNTETFVSVNTASHISSVAAQQCNEPSSQSTWPAGINEATVPCSNAHVRYSYISLWAPDSTDVSVTITRKRNECPDENPITSAPTSSFPSGDMCKKLSGASLKRTTVVPIVCSSGQTWSGITGSGPSNCAYVCSAKYSSAVIGDQFVLTSTAENLGSCTCYQLTGTINSDCSRFTDGTTSDGTTFFGMFTGAKLTVRWETAAVGGIECSASYVLDVTANGAKASGAVSLRLGSAVPSAVVVASLGFFFG